MAGSIDPYLEHLLRRAGFGARSDELASAHSFTSEQQAADVLTNYEATADDVDQKIGQPGYAGTTSRGPFSPNSDINDARQRWLFRMVHTNRPLQEKMTLFWHNHFATGYNKIANELGSGSEGARYMAAKPAEDPAGVTGQIEMLRANALGNFRDILLNIAKDTAMVVWLDGRTNTKANPQENFAREIMELFTVGVGNYTEPDVYAGARVFTGWNLQRVGASGTPAQHWEFFYNANQHETTAKTFSFPIYADGSSTIPARSAAQGMLDGIDLINALAASPNTARYLSTKLYRYFVSEVGNPDPGLVDRLVAVYLQSGLSIRAVIREIFVSPLFWDDKVRYARYAWPVEFVARALKDFGWSGFSLNDALAPLSNMGQNLFEPPDVSGWDLGQSWFSTGAMLARVNFAAALAANQRFNLAAAGKGVAGTPESLLSAALGLPQVPPFDSGVAVELLNYLRSTGPWTGSDAQLRAKVPGLIHLIVGSPEYQLV